jgi:hypothetical protein
MYMRALRTGLVTLLIIGISTSAFAGDIASSVANAAQQQQEERAPKPRSSKPLVYTGTALFVGGMAVGLFAFINNKNGSFAEFGEADAVNKPLGAAALSAAFVGGTMMFIGSHRAKRAPSISVGVDRIKVSKQISW